MADSDDTRPAADPAPNPDLRLTLDESGLGARVKVIGVGGGGGNAVHRVAEAGITGVDLIVANTDAQALAQNAARFRLQIGAKLTSGLGAGADPDVGRQAALEDTEQIIGALSGADMVFVTAGLGGGTGTGAAPVIAALASELGALTIAVVTKPFRFEGRRRMKQAARGLEELRNAADTVLAIPNERLLATVERQTALTEAFRAADDVLNQAIRGIADLITVPGLINLDFADVKSVMSGRGMAIMGTGLGRGESRCVDAATAAVTSPLIEDARIDGAHGVIVNVTGGSDLTMIETSEATEVIQQAAHEDANFIFGAVIDPAMEGQVKVTVIATDFDGAAARRTVADTPVDLGQFAGRRTETPPPMAVAAGGPGFSVARRPAVELSPPAPLPVDGEAAADPDAAPAAAAADLPTGAGEEAAVPEAGEADGAAAAADAPADDAVPAFLRRAAR